MNLLILGSHLVLEHDDVKLFSELGYDVFSPGGYERPEAPVLDARPALPHAPRHPEFADLCHEQRVKHGAAGIEWAIDWAKADIHPDILDWADVVMVNCYPERWLTGQWKRLRGKRVIWRTIGQSGPQTEELMKPLRSDGLEIVRYSPAERRAYSPYPWWAGEDAMIRFAKDPAEWYGWTGEEAVVGNVTQDMIHRGQFCGLDFYATATQGLPAKPAGQGSEGLPGGVGFLSYEGLREYLRSVRCYLYTGTQPASYTLGLIEAMMTGVPVVSIGPAHMWLPPLFEGAEIAGQASFYSDDPGRARGFLLDFLNKPNFARGISEGQRAVAIELFGSETIAAQWGAYLGAPVREAVTA